MTPDHPEYLCERCHGLNVVWFAPSQIWNQAHGEFDILCPVCFVSLAEAAGIKPTAWQIAPEGYSEHEGRAFVRTNAPKVAI